MLALPASFLLKLMRIFMCDPAFDAVVTFLRGSGLPATLTMDRDVRWVGSATQRDFPSALLRFL
jgi:hypothetical protein